LREVVQLHVQDDLSEQMGLSSGLDGNSLRGSAATNIALGRGSSEATESGFDITVGSTSVAINVISIIALLNESDSVTTNFITELSGRVEVESRSTVDTLVSGLACQTTLSAWNTSLLLRFEEGTRVACAGRIGIGVGRNDYTLTVEFVISILALADSTPPVRVGLVVASIAAVSEVQTITDTL
jgi:hypothetical protein